MKPLLLLTILQAVNLTMCVLYTTSLFAVSFAAFGFGYLGALLFVAVLEEKFNG